MSIEMANDAEQIVKTICAGLVYRVGSVRFLAENKAEWDAIAPLLSGGRQRLDALVEAYNEFERAIEQQYAEALAFVAAFVVIEHEGATRHYFKRYENGQCYDIDREDYERMDRLDWRPIDSDGNPIPLIAECDQLRTRVAALEEQISSLEAKIDDRQESLADINDGTDEPYYQPDGIGAGLEDREITDRYEAGEYGWRECQREYQEWITSLVCPYFPPNSHATTAQCPPLGDDGVSE